MNAEAAPETRTNFRSPGRDARLRPIEKTGFSPKHTSVRWMISLVVLCALLFHQPRTDVNAFQTSEAEYTRTSLLSDGHISALASEISGLIAKDTVIELARHHRVQASPGFSGAARYIAGKAKEYGLEQVRIERFTADGIATYHTLKSTPGWEAEQGELWEISPARNKVADYQEMNVALADYSEAANVTATLVDVGSGTSAKEYEGREVRGKIVLAGGGLADVHRMACDQRGAAGILSYQQNQTTAWSGDYVDSVRWGHLSPYNPDNRFAFMISLRRADEYRRRLANGERITLRANVKAAMRPGHYEVVTAVIPGSGLESDDEIVYSCHLCHQKPGANDNASGAAAILEVARALTRLIRRGDLEPPRRTIRFIWPPEINGTLAYFAANPDIVRRMKAAIHLDMVGGHHSITKSVLHVTRTPASIPSCTNDVAEVFANYAIQGSVRAASGLGFEDALISPQGSKDSLVAAIAPYEMGSDHDVYQEGSFRIPTVYLRDWPDVFIHTNNDVPDNIDATKIKRSTFIAAASGYFMARAGADDAIRLADEVFARALARVPEERRRAGALESAGQEGPAEARNVIARAVERAAEAIASVTMFAEGNKDVEARVDSLVDQLSGAWLLLTGQLTEQRRGNRIIFTLEPREEPKPQRPRGTREPPQPKTAPPETAIPVRRVLGPMNVYYYDYVRDRLDPAGSTDLDEITARVGGGLVLYEILNLVDGKRSVRDIRDYVSAAYHLVAVEDVRRYLRLLEKIGVLRFEE